MSGFLGIGDSRSKSGNLGTSNGGGWELLRKINIATESAGSHRHDMCTVETAPNSVYSVILNNLDATSGTSGYSLFIRASADGGGSWLNHHSMIKFQYGSAPSSSSNWDAFSDSTNGWWINHNHQVGFGLSGSYYVCTGPQGHGSHDFLTWGQSVYDSDNQGDVGHSRVGGRFTGSDGWTDGINRIRLYSSTNSLTPNYGTIAIYKVS